MIVGHDENWKWKNVDVLVYKEDGNIFRDVTRQVLFTGSENLPLQQRYFEVKPQGYTTLERHAHEHLVTVIRGGGRVFVGDAVHTLSLFDVVYIPALTWHQFRADNDYLGFLCLVRVERDKPQLPGPADLEQLRTHKVVADFIRV